MGGPLAGKVILLVDDEELLRNIVRLSFELQGADVREASGGHAALAIYQQGGIDVIVSDLRMPEGGGLPLLQAVRLLNKHVPFILFTGYSEVSPAEALAAGADAFLLKPFDLDQLVRAAAMPRAA